MGNTYDVAIAGGGIAGAACAEACAASGLSVVVVEPGPVGGGATAAGMGHIAVMDDSPAQISLTNYSRTLWRERASDLPADVEYVEAGTLWVAADEEEMEECRRKLGVYRSIGVRAEVLGAREMAAAEPNLRPGLAGGLLVPDDAVVYPPCAARYMLERARQQGAVLRIGESAVSLSGQGIKLRDGSVLSAGITVNATGAWAPELTPGIEVRKRKGHLVITDRYPGWVRHQLVELGYLKSAHSTTEDSVAFNVQPRRTGQLLIGSSRQFGVTHSGIEHQMLTRMLRRAQQYMPGLADLSAIRSWTGFRAATPDKLPLIGPCPGDERMYLATGQVARYMLSHDADVNLVAEQAPQSALLRFGVQLARHPRKLVQAIKLRAGLLGVPYITSCWPISAQGGEHLQSVTLRRSNGATWTETCDYLACGFGLVPNLELAALLGCRQSKAGVEVDARQQTSVAGVYSAGEATGIGGLELSLVEGEIAGYAAGGSPDRAKALFGARQSHRKFAAALEQAFALRDELRQLPQPGTMLCRCEDVTMERVRACAGWREAKLHTRCGMGPCQGRICGAAAEFLLGWQSESVRPPVFPARVRSMTR